MEPESSLPYSQVPAYIYTYICICIRTYTYIYMYMYVYIYILDDGLAEEKHVGKGIL
jgi:hypothetical protein